MINLGTHSPLICDALWLICSIAGLWPPLNNCVVVLDQCVLGTLGNLWELHGLHESFCNCMQALGTVCIGHGTKCKLM